MTQFVVLRDSDLASYDHDHAWTSLSGFGYPRSIGVVADRAKSSHSRYFRRLEDGKLLITRDPQGASIFAINCLPPQLRWRTKAMCCCAA